LGRSDCQCVEEEILLMAASGVTIDPDISGRDDPPPMLCLAAQLSVLFGTHHEMDVLRRDGAAEQILYIPSGAAIRSELLLVGQRTPGAIHDNSPGANTYKRRLVPSGGVPRLSVFGDEL
jgi:hypothetical protein